MNATPKYLVALTTALHSSEEDKDYVPEEYYSDEGDSGDGGKEKVSAKMAMKKTRLRQQGGIKLDDADHNITEEEDEGSKQDLEEDEILLKTTATKYLGANTSQMRLTALVLE